MTPSVRPSIFGPDDMVQSGVSTRHGGISPYPLGMNLSYRVGDTEENVRTNRGRFLGEFGFREDQTAFAAQCHSSVIKVVTAPGLFQDCDGLITNQKGLGLAISIADCVPVLLYDPVTTTIAAVHAGWRGSMGRISAKCCEAMEREYGVRTGDLLAFIGPSAGPCCYEVGHEVAAQFRDSVQHDLREGQSIDLKQENRLQLEESGILSANIEVDERCTICNEAMFHSYRREKEQSGRMLAFIGLSGM